MSASDGAAVTAADADRAGLVERLAAVPDRLALVASAADPGPGSGPPAGWSPREVVLHLAAVEEVVWQARLDSLAGELLPRWSWTEPGLWSGPGDDTWDGALAAFADRRAATVATLEALDEAGWARRGRHDTYGVLDVAALLRIALDHDEEHLAQIGRG